MSNRYEDGRDGEARKEPSLKDALLPEKPGPQGPPGGRTPGRTPGRRGAETPSLQDALLPEGHQPSPPPVSKRPSTADTKDKKEGQQCEADVATATASFPVIPVIVAMAIVVGFAAMFVIGRMSNVPANPPAPPETGAVGAAQRPGAPAPPSTTQASNASLLERLTAEFDDPGPLGLAEIQQQGLIVDVHEHIESLELAPQYLAAMDQLGIQTMCLMGSSKFTLTLNEAYGFTEYDENNEELIKIVEAYPGRFEAWPTVDPEDPEKLAKIQDLVARGASGVKLYIGHGYVTKKHTYMFHTVAMDDSGMLPLYAWCEENYVPLMLHVNPFGEKIGFAEEFIAVLSAYPDLKVIAPHFILSSVYSARLEELLDTFPNLYSDISFGDYFMSARLTYMSKYPKKFRKILGKYPDRFMFASDLVMIKNRPDDWAPTQMQAYLDMLTKEKYTSAAITERHQVPGERPERRPVELTGLNLSDDLVSRILFRNYRAFRASRPSGTEITHEIDWKKMNQERVEREPGQAFPPKPKSAGE